MGYRLVKKLQKNNLPIAQKLHFKNAKNSKPK
jgi:hypothetical protein